MFRVRSIVVLAFTLLGSLLPLQPLKAAAAISCPDVLDIKITSVPSHTLAQSINGGVPWFAGGVQVSGVIDLDTSACTPGGTTQILNVPIPLKSSNPSAASVPPEVVIPQSFATDQSVGFTITTYPQNSAETATISANLDSVVSTVVGVLPGSPKYSVRDLGTLPGQSFSAAYALNNNGTVVGESGGAAGSGHAFSWSAATGMADLGVFPGQTTSKAVGVNDSGVIAGTSGFSSAHAVTWQGGVITDVGEAGALWSQAFAINGAGQVVGSYSGGTAGLAESAFVWSPGSGLATLDPLMSTSFGDSRATSINDAGTVIGLSSGDSTPVRWDGVNALDLGIPPGMLKVNDRGSTPTPHVANAGQVVFGNLLLTGGSWTGLPTVTVQFYGNPSTIQPDGRGINRQGDVVGQLGGSEFSSGFVYHNGQIQDLNLLVDQSHGWWIQDARAINDQGQIAAIGAAGGSYNLHAVLLTPIATDTTPPLVTPQVVPAPNANGWNNSDTTVTWSVRDPESGIASSTGCSPTTLTAEAADTILTCTAVNGVGLSTSRSIAMFIDKTPPTVTYSHNAGAYTVDQTVSITCLAADNLSGVATTTCQNVSTPAYNYPIGSNTLSATATDEAGNVGSGNTTFSVSVTPGSLCTLTARFMSQSANYQQLVQAIGPVAAAWVAQIASTTCSSLNAISIAPYQKAYLIGAYQAATVRLANYGWLTADQAALLSGLSTHL